MEKPKSPAELVRERFAIPPLELYRCFEYHGKVYQIDSIEIRENAETIELAIGGRDVSFLLRETVNGR